MKNSRSAGTFRLTTEFPLASLILKRYGTVVNVVIVGNLATPKSSKSAVVVTPALVKLAVHPLVSLGALDRFVAITINLSRLCLILRFFFTADAFALRAISAFLP